MHHLIDDAVQLLQEETILPLYSTTMTITRHVSQTCTTETLLLVMYKSAVKSKCEL